MRSNRKPSRRLLCDSNPMCYGSSSALLSILEHVDAHVTALASGITLELLSTDPGVDEVLEVEVKSPEEVSRAIEGRSFDAVLVVSNQSNIEVYASLGIPIFFVDILYFFGARKDQRVWELAQTGFAQAFPGVSERIDAGASPSEPVLVGPLVRTLDGADTPRDGTLVNLGGGRSRWIIPGVNSDYPAMVVTWLEAMIDALPSPITIAAGAEAAAVARDAITSPHMRAVTYPQQEFLEALQSSALYLTAPGLNAVFEGALFAAEMLFLPPQNATQVSQLGYYERAGLTHAGINLPALDPRFDEDAITSGEDRFTDAVLSSLARLSGDEATTSRVNAHLSEQRERAPERARAARAFMDALGGPGGQTIAAHIHTFWGES